MLISVTYKNCLSAAIGSLRNMMRQRLRQDTEATRLHVVENGYTSSVKLEHTRRSCDRSSSIPQDIHDEVEVPDSLRDEFADVEFIPETPLKNIGKKRSVDSNQTEDGKCPQNSKRTPPLLQQRRKKRRTESIHSVGDAQQHTRRLSEETAVGDEQRLYGSPSAGPPIQMPVASITTRLKPVPQGAPRIVERKGQYTIRKGVRIRDYKLLGPNPWPRAPPPTSKAYQCRDGFDDKEASLGYPQRMMNRPRGIDYPEVASRCDSSCSPRSLSLGTPNPA